MGAVHGVFLPPPAVTKKKNWCPPLQASGEGGRRGKMGGAQKAAAGRKGGAPTPLIAVHGPEGGKETPECFFPQKRRCGGGGVWKSQDGTSPWFYGA